MAHLTQNELGTSVSIIDFIHHYPRALFYDIQLEVSLLQSFFNNNNIYLKSNVHRDTSSVDYSNEFKYSSRIYSGHNGFNYIRRLPL